MNTFLMQNLDTNTQGKNSWFMTYLQSLQGNKPCDGKAINDVLFSRSRFLTLSSWGSGAGWGGFPVTLSLRVRGEVKHRAFYMVVSDPIWSPFPIPHWPRLPLLAEAIRSRAIHVLHQKKTLDKPTPLRSKHRQYLTSTCVKISTVSRQRLSMY